MPSLARDVESQAQVVTGADSISRVSQKSDARVASYLMKSVHIITFSPLLSFSGGQLSR